MSRSRASSTTSSAPEKTLWSVIAIAPRPSASAWSSRSAGGTRQSCDALVCMCRSTTIQSRSASGSASRFGARRRPRSALVDLLELVRDVGERLPLRGARALARAPLAVRVVVGEPAHLGRRELRLLVRSRRSGDGGAGGARLEREPREAVRRRDEDRRLVEDRRAARRSRARVRTSTRSTSVRGTYGRVVSGFVRSSVSRQSGSSPSVCSAAREQRPLGLAPLEHDQPLLVHRLEQRRVDALGDEPVVARESVAAAAAAVSSRRREQRVDPAEQPLALRAPRRVGEALRREERRDGEALGVAQREVREARQRRARSRARRRSGRCGARARGSSARRRGTPTRLRREIGTAGPSDDEPLSSSEPLWSASRPAARSAARFDDARIVTACPSTRSSCAMPGDVLVHVVRLRPRERRDEADPERHRARV